MDLVFELLNTYAPAKSCNSLLYTPTDSQMQARETRLYRFSISGDPAAAQAFVRDVLADELTDQIHEGESPLLTDFSFFLDVRLKPGCLDLEKEYILRYFHELDAPGFTIESLTVVRRIYLSNGTDVPEERFVNDIVNPVIHAWNVHHA